MIRTVAFVLAMLALVMFTGSGMSADPVPGKAVKAQMVKGTIKTVDPAKNLLVVKQQLKGMKGSPQDPIISSSPSIMRFTSVSSKRPSLCPNRSVESVRI